MNVFFLYLIRISLALIVGGIVVVGAVVAPSVFMLVHDKTLAGEVMTEIFRRLNWITVGGSLFIASIEIIRSTMFGGVTQLFRAQKWRTLSLILLIGFSLYIGFWITPELNELRLHLSASAPLPHRFGSLHRLSEVMYSITFLIAMVLLFLFRRVT